MQGSPKAAVPVVVVPPIKSKPPPPEAVKIVVQARPTADVSVLREALLSLQEVKGAKLLSAAEQDDGLAQVLAELTRATSRLRDQSLIAFGHSSNVMAMSEFFVSMMVVLDRNGTWHLYCSFVGSVPPAPRPGPDRHLSLHFPL